MDSCQVQADCITRCRAQQKAAKPIIEGCSETIGILCHKARIQGLIAKKQPEIQVFIKCTGEVLRMRQTAVVVSKNGKIAEIRVERASMCDGCTHKNCDSHTCAAGSLMGAGKTLVTRAYGRQCRRYRSRGDCDKKDPFLCRTGLSSADSFLRRLLRGRKRDLPYSGRCISGPFPFEQRKYHQ